MLVRWFLYISLTERVRVYSEDLRAEEKRQAHVKRCCPDGVEKRKTSIALTVVILDSEERARCGVRQ